MEKVIIAAVLVVVMIAGCYLFSGLSLIEGTIFERKTPVSKK